MKVAVIGASGNAGSRITTELLNRGHDVTGICRHPENLPVADGLIPAKGDVQDPAELAKLLLGHDAVIHSVRFLDSDAGKVIAAVSDSGVHRLLVVGGAGSLKANGVALLDGPGFPEVARPEATSGREFLNTLKEEGELDWTYLSPSMIFAPGERTHTFRLGADDLLTAADGKSSISMEDYAIALVDELEQPRHSRQRFTVGY